MPDETNRPTDAEIEATCERWSTAMGRRSLVEVVDAMVVGITRDTEACKNRTVSMGEFNVYKYKAAHHLRTLLELAEWDYFGSSFELTEYR